MAATGSSEPGRIAPARRPRARRSLIGLWATAGSAHFLIPQAYDRIIPPPLDRHARKVTYASGVAELAGAALLASGARTAARWWLLATLAGVYPANIYMALRPERFPRVPRWSLYARLPVQFAFAWHIWVGTAEER